MGSHFRLNLAISPALLNQQISALRRQIAALEDALEASEDQDRESQTKIADLGKRLNVALAQRVQELNRYRSDFFGRLREILSDRSDIRIVGEEYKNVNFTGKDICSKRDIEIYYNKREHSFSTTELRERIHAVGSTSIKAVS